MTQKFVYVTFVKHMQTKTWLISISFFLFFLYSLLCNICRHSFYFWVIIHLIYADECELRGMTPERIYLLARMGNTKAALALIIRELADIEYAVDFCKG